MQLLTKQSIILRHITYICNYPKIHPIQSDGKLVTNHVWRPASDRTLFNVVDSPWTLQTLSLITPGGHLTVCVALVISILVSGGSVAFVGVVVPAVVGDPPCEGIDAAEADLDNGCRFASCGGCHCQCWLTRRHHQCSSQEDVDAFRLLCLQK